MNLPVWLSRLIDLFGKNDVRATGASKHGRAHQKPRNWKQHRKTMRKMAAASRRINRRMQ